MQVISMADKLLTPNFDRSDEQAAALADPIADTAMVVTLDELRAYELNPRLTPNPRFNDLRASIRERGLDAPPAITRRPGDSHFIIRNGGNTRLAILRELWESTGEERFYRIACLFRPWPSRGEIVALTGHLSENELRGGLTFIERALGVEKARELYEHERGQALSQSELARLLSGDGYPISQPHISRMQEAVLHLLPAIPALLHAGLGRPQIERLIALRRAGLRTWEACPVQATAATTFDALFLSVLAAFDAPCATSLQVARVQDELVHRIAEHVSGDYDAIALMLNDAQVRHQTLAATPTASSGDTAPAPELTVGSGPSPQRDRNVATTLTRDADDKVRVVDADTHTPDISGEPTTPRLEAIRKLIHTTGAMRGGERGHAEEQETDYPPPSSEALARLRTDIATHARRFAAMAGVEHCVQEEEAAYGFSCAPVEAAAPGHAQAVVAVLRGLTEPDRGGGTSSYVLNSRELIALLLGSHKPTTPRLTDSALATLVRLIALMRRVHDHVPADAPLDTQEAACPVPTP